MGLVLAPALAAVTARAFVNYGSPASCLVLNTRPVPVMHSVLCTAEKRVQLHVCNDGQCSRGGTVPRGRTVPTDVSKSVSAVSFGDFYLDANAVALAVAWTPPEDSTVSIETYELYLARTLRRAPPLFPSTIGACMRTMRVAVCPGLRRRTTRVSRPT